MPLTYSPFDDGPPFDDALAQRSAVRREESLAVLAMGAVFAGALVLIGLWLWFFDVR